MLVPLCFCARNSTIKSNFTKHLFGLRVLERRVHYGGAHGSKWQHSDKGWKLRDHIFNHTGSRKSGLEVGRGNKLSNSPLSVNFHQQGPISEKVHNHSKQHHQLGTERSNILLPVGSISHSTCGFSLFYFYLFKLL